MWDTVANEDDGLEYAWDMLAASIRAPQIRAKNPQRETTQRSKMAFTARQRPSTS